VEVHSQPEFTPAARGRVAGDAGGGFPLAFLVVAIVYDFTEAAFNRMDFIWFILLLAMVGRLLPLPAVEPSRLELSIETWDRNVHAPR